MEQFVQWTPKSLAVFVNALIMIILILIIMNMTMVWIMQKLNHQSLRSLKKNALTGKQIVLVMMIVHNVLLIIAPMEQFVQWTPKSLAVFVNALIMIILILIIMNMTMVWIISTKIS